MSFMVVSFTRASISYLASIWTLCLPCCTGRTLGLSVTEYSPGILPILLKESGNFPQTFYTVYGCMVL